MSNTNAAETEDNIRLRKSAEFLAHCKQVENEARLSLARAVEQTKFAKNKHESLFIECEKRAVQRRKAGLIPVNPGY